MNLLHQIDTTDFSENELLILEYFIAHEKSLPYMSLNDICKDLFISNATIVRFCQKIGFNGFNELKILPEKGLKRINRIFHLERYAASYLHT